MVMVQGREGKVWVSTRGVDGKNIYKLLFALETGTK